MKQVTIFRMEENKKILLRIVNVSPTFIGIGKKGQINVSDFAKLANDLEPKNTGYTLMDI